MKKVFLFLLLAVFEVSAQWVNWDVQKLSGQPEIMFGGDLNNQTGKYIYCKMDDSIQGGTFYIELLVTTFDELTAVLEIQDENGKIINSCFASAIKGDTGKATMVVEITPYQKKIIVYGHKVIATPVGTGLWRAKMIFDRNYIVSALPIVKPQFRAQSKAGINGSYDLMGRCSNQCKNRALITGNKTVIRVH